jgi:hypothetical protein
MDMDTFPRLEMCLDGRKIAMPLRERIKTVLEAAPLPTVALGMRLALSSTGLLEQRTYGSDLRTQNLRRLSHSDPSSPNTYETVPRRRLCS